jgi:hypothetical protein
MNKNQWNVHMEPGARIKSKLTGELYVVVASDMVFSGNVGRMVYYVAPAKIVENPSEWDFEDK